MRRLQNYDSIARLMAGVDRPPTEFRNALRDLIQQANPDLPVRVPMTMQEQIDGGLWRQRAAASLLGFFGLLALACAGIHGVVAYSTAQRTREVGIRMALGADGSRVFREVIGRGVACTAAGIGLGLPLAIRAKPMLQGFLYDAQAVEPVVFAGIPALFLLVAAVAGSLPARRAAATHPVSALRQE